MCRINSNVGSDVRVLSTENTIYGKDERMVVIFVSRTGRDFSVTLRGVCQVFYCIQVSGVMLLTTSLFKDDVNILF